MEFERSIFHMHDRFMSSPSSKTLLTWLKWMSLFFTFHCFLRLFAYHRIYVN